MEWGKEKGGTGKGKGKGGTGKVKGGTGKGEGWNGEEWNGEGVAFLLKFLGIPISFPSHLPKSLPARLILLAVSCILHQIIFLEIFLNRKQK